MHSGKYFRRMRFAVQLRCCRRRRRRARDALGRAIRTRLITCICNCSNVTPSSDQSCNHHPIDSASTERPTDRPVEFRSTYLLLLLLLLLAIRPSSQWSSWAAMRNTPRRGDHARREPGWKRVSPTFSPTQEGERIINPPGFLIQKPMNDVWKIAS